MKKSTNAPPERRESFDEYFGLLDVYPFRFDVVTP
jgi:hypothetical protein